MKRRKTLVDVAAAAGVSKMTASRAMRGDKDVSQANIDRVRHAAREIGYYGNHLAASLSSERSNLIGVVVPSLANIVFTQVLSGITDCLSGKGYQPVFGVTDYDAGREYEITRNILSWSPSGLIVTGLEQSPDTRKLLTEADVPIVQMMDCDGEPVGACVGFSHIDAGYQMASALVAAGRKRIGYVGCNLDKDHRGAKRRKGFLKALQDLGFEAADSVTQAGLSSVEAGRKLTGRILSRCPELDCIYYSNDDLAVGGLCHCIDRGIAVPDRIVLAGFNGLDLIEGFPGKIVTSRTSRREIGEMAARIILETLEDPATVKSGKYVFQPTISLGDLSSSVDGSR